MAGRILWRYAHSGTGFLVGIWSICLQDAPATSLALIKIPSPHACTPTAAHFGSSTHFSIPCVFAPSHFPAVPCTIHTFHTGRHHASRDQCEARDTHVCRASSHVVVRAPVRLPPGSARRADGPTPACPVAGTAAHSPHDAAGPVDLQSRQVPVFTSHSHVEASASRRPVVGAGGRAAQRLRVGLKAGPGAAARLEAGSCEGGFACLFQMCAVFSHQACAGGSVFFRRQLSKAGLSGTIYHLRLILDPFLACAALPPARRRARGPGLPAPAALMAGPGDPAIGLARGGRVVRKGV